MVIFKHLIIEGNNTSFNGIKELCFMSHKNVLDASL